MFKVVKVLNNNGILAENQNDQSEYIFLGKGIGFSQKKENYFETLSGAKMYKLQDDIERVDEMIRSVDPVYFDITNEIIIQAEERFGEIDNKILIPLADHIAFSIERIKSGLKLNNPFETDIKALFAEEFEVAKKSIGIIEKYTGFVIDEEEVAYITMHIHSALTNEHISQSMSVARLSDEFIREIEDNFHIKVDKESLSYNRFISHLKYMITRVLRDEPLQVDITSYVKSEFPESYDIAQKMSATLEKSLGKQVKDIEIGYLAIHIERVRKSKHNV